MIVMRKKSREEEKEKCECSPDADEKTAVREDEIDHTRMKSKQLDSLRGSYSLMDAAKTVTLETTLEGVLADCTFVRFKDVDEYNRISNVKLKRYKVAAFKDQDDVYHEYYRYKQLHHAKRAYDPRYPFYSRLVF